MDPKGSLLHSQGVATDPYPEPDESSSNLHTLFKIHFVFWEKSYLE
jgi:hypothetical protein